MKKILLLAFLTLVFIQSNAQIIINELEADAGNNDGTGGDWIELKNIGPLSEDLSCYGLSNGGSVIITIPSGLILPSGAYLLIGNASKMMCNTCDFKSMNLMFSLNTDGYGPGIAMFSNTIFLNTDLAINGGCGCLTGSGNYNSGSGTGDRVVLYDASGTIVDAMMYAGGNNYGNGPININFVGTATCSVNSNVLPAVSNPVYNGRTICNDLSGCNSSYARMPDGNNGALVTYDQSGNLACTNCLIPCATGAINTASTDYPTPGLSNSLGTSTWSATLNSAPISSSAMTVTVCGSTPMVYSYNINNFTNAALVATQPSGNLGSYVLINGGTPIAFSTANYNSLSGTTTLTSTFTPPNGTTHYEFVWGNGNSNCISCPGSNSTTVPNTLSSPQQECYVSNTLVVIREDSLGGTMTATCSIPGSIMVNGATGTNIQYTLQKQTTSGGAFATVAGPFTSNIIGGIFDDDADTSLPNYRVLVSSVNTVCPNPSPFVVAVPKTCLGNPACPKYIGTPSFTPASGSVVCAGSPLQFTVNISGVCTTGQVEVYYSYNPGFDPYTSGTLLGIANTTVGITPPSTIAAGKVFINEFVVRPAQGTCTGTPDGVNPNSGEWVELYNAGPTSVDISGWKIADGDWTATIPAGTLMTSGLHYLIGGGGTFCSSGVMPDLNIETCNCATVVTGSDMMNLTNGGEQLALFDCDTNFIDGVLWGTSGQAIPDTTANIGPTTGCGNYIPQKSVNLPAPASFSSSGTIPAPNSGKYRTSTNTWVTTAATAITPKAANPGGNWTGATVPFGKQCPPPPVTSTISVNLPDTCSQTSTTAITIKAIYKPTPIAPCTKTDVTAIANYTIPSCELATLSGNGEYCVPNTAPLSISLSNPLTGNYSFNLSNGTNTVSINPATGAGPFTTNVSNSGVWKIASITPPAGLCPPKAVDSAIVQIHPIPAIISAPANASFCYQAGFDLTSLEPSIATLPSGSEFVWYDSVVGGLPIFPYVNPSSTTTYYVAATTGAPANCEETTRTAIVLNIDPLPNIPNINCNGTSATFIPQSPDCSPTPCPTGLEYSANGTNWGAGPTFVSSDSGWSAFGAPFNSLVYIRNASLPSCFTYVTYFNPCLAPLPTELFNFFGKLKTNQTVDLRWQTAQEINVSHFEIEKSDDQATFIKIGAVKAIGNTSNISDYFFTDEHLLQGSNFYRLRIVDIDSQYAYSNVIKIEALNGGSSIQNIYPNPSHDRIRIDFSAAKNEKAIVQILNTLGQVVLQREDLMSKGINHLSYNIESLIKGSYTLRIIMNHRNYSSNFIKE